MEKILDDNGHSAPQEHVEQGQRSAEFRLFLLLSSCRSVQGRRSGGNGEMAKK